MKREFQRLEGGPFDVLVIGGGIYGAWVAYDAALRGLSVALVEKEDWAAGTSSASSKLIHGGLRYLEHWRFGLVRKALRERELLARLGPHRVYPLRLGVPLYSGGRMGRLRLKAGLWLYDRLAGADLVVDRHRMMGAAEFLEAFPFVKKEGLKGGFVFGDCQTDDARFALEIVDGAQRAGAVAVNGVEAAALLRDGTRITGATVRDRETGTSVDVRARMTVNCAGPWIRRVLDGIEPPVDTQVRLSKGVHLVLPPLPSRDALLLTSAIDGRVVFLLPWYGKTLLGTTDTDFQGSLECVSADSTDSTSLLAEANRVLAGPPWEERDVVARFAGLRVLPRTEERSSADVTREWFLLEHGEGLISSMGGKYSSARVDAASLVSRVLQQLGRAPGPCPTDDLPFPWRPPDAFAGWAGRVLERGVGVGLDELAAASCRMRHGNRVDRLLDLIEQRPEWARRIMPEAPFCLAELAFAVTDEMARTLEDVLRRRVPLLLVARVPEYVLEEVADIVGDLLGWTPERRRREIDRLLQLQ